VPKQSTCAAGQAYKYCPTPYSGPNLTRAVLIADGSTGAVVVDNTTTGNRATVEVDGSSRAGSHVENNSPT
jgi:hypothetical protein